MSAEIIDQASELEELLRIDCSPPDWARSYAHIDNAIQAHRINHNAVSATHCMDCCKPIPDPRRSAMPGYVLCIDCQKYDDLIRARG